MSLYQHVTVKSVTEDTIIVELPNGEEFSWQREVGDHLASGYEIGDQLILTLTTSHAILNELMTSSDGQEKNSKQHKTVPKGEQ